MFVFVLRLDIVRYMVMGWPEELRNGTGKLFAGVTIRRYIVEHVGYLWFRQANDAGGHDLDQRSQSIVVRKI